jgi:hypothetical protein
MTLQSFNSAPAVLGGAIDVPQGDFLMTERSIFKASETQYELRFTGLFNKGRGYAFPCDAAGHVDIDRFTDRVRLSYLDALAVVGKELSCPMVALVC